MTFSKLDQWVDNKIVQNIIIWLFVLLIFSVTIQSENPLIAALSIIAFIAVPIYINNLIVLPLYFQNRYALGWLLFLVNIIIFTILGVALLSGTIGEFSSKMFLNVFGGVLLSLLFGTSLKISRDSFLRRQKEKEAELKLLKAQLNPHFLFNTLNNLYGLSVLKSDKLPNLMLKLSDLLRYSLYETKEITVPIAKEIQYLENYVSLERIRLENETEIEFIKKGDYTATMIAPMLLIVFVENAFKHLGTLKGQKSKVGVSLNIDDNVLHFRCANTKDTNTLDEEHLEKGKSGIGIINAKKRLELLYPNKHELKINSSKTEHEVILKLNVL